MKNLVLSLGLVGGIFSCISVNVSAMLDQNDDFYENVSSNCNLENDISPLLDQNDDFYENVGSECNLENNISPLLDQNDDFLKNVVFGSQQGIESNQNLEVFFLNQ